MLFRSAMGFVGSFSALAAWKLFGRFNESIALFLAGWFSIALPALLVALIRSLAFSPDGKYLAVGGMGQVGNIDHLEGKARVEIFEWQSSVKTHIYSDNEFKGLVQSLAFHPSGSWLMAAGGDNTGFVMFFDLKEPKKSIRDEKAPMHIHRATLNETGDAIYAVGHNKIVKWKVSSVPA